MNNKLERHINIRVTQEHLDWLDEMVDRDESHETCISTILRDLIDKAMKEEEVFLKEAEKAEMEARINAKELFNDVFGGKAPF